MPRETQEISVAKNAKVFPVCFVHVQSSEFMLNILLHRSRIHFKNSLNIFFRCQWLMENKL